MTWWNPWRSLARVEAERINWRTRCDELHCQIDALHRDFTTIRAHLGDAHRAIAEERAMGALAERVAEGYRARASQAESDVLNAQAQWECDGLSLTLRNVEIVGLTAERDIARGELDTLRAYIDTLHADLAHGALFRVAGGRLGTWEQWVEWKTGVGAQAGSQEAVA